MENINNSQPGMLKKHVPTGFVLLVVSLIISYVFYYAETKMIASLFLVAAILGGVSGLLELRNEKKGQSATMPTRLLKSGAKILFISAAIFVLIMYILIMQIPL